MCCGISLQAWFLEDGAKPSVGHVSAQPRGFADALSHVARVERQRLSYVLRLSGLEKHGEQSGRNADMQATEQPARIPSAMEGNVGQDRSAAGLIVCLLAPFIQARLFQTSGLGRFPAMSSEAWQATGVAGAACEPILVAAAGSRFTGGTILQCAAADHHLGVAEHTAAADGRSRAGGHCVALPGQRVVVDRDGFARRPSVCCLEAFASGSPRVVFALRFSTISGNRSAVLQTSPRLSRRELSNPQSVGEQGMARRKLPHATR